MILNYFESEYEIHEKGFHNPVTTADYVADQSIKETLMKNRPDYGWLSEETVDSLERLKKRKGMIPTPRGDLGVEWHVSKEKYVIHLSVPINTVLNVKVDTMKDAVLDQIKHNGSNFPDRVTDFLRLESGQYQIEVFRNEQVK